MIDHRPVADEAAQPEIALEQGRQLGQRGFLVDLLTTQPFHVDKALRQGRGTQLRRCQVRAVQVGQRQGQGVGIGARQTGTAQHQRHVEVEDVLGDAGPKELHEGAATIVPGDAGAAKLHDLAGIGHQRADVVLRRGIEATHAGCLRPPHEAVGGDNLPRQAGGGLVAVEHQQVVAEGIEGVELPPHGAHLWARLGRHLLAEDLVPQRLGGLDLLRRLCQAKPEAAQLRVDRPLVRRRALGVVLEFVGHYRPRRVPSAVARPARLFGASLFGRALSAAEDRVRFARLTSLQL